MELVDVIKPWLLALVLAVPRLTGLLLMLPFMSQQMLPGQVRNTLIVVLALPLLPSMREHVPTEPVFLHLLGLVAKELLLGVAIGFSVAILFWAIEGLGFFIDNQRGTTMASSVSPMTGEQTSPLGLFLSQTLSVFFLVGGGLLALLLLVYESYDFWPVTAFTPQVSSSTALYFLGLLDELMVATVFYAAPVVIAMFLAELALGLISRFTPQLNVFFLAMPIKSGIAFFVLILYLGVLLQVFAEGLGALDARLLMLRKVLE
ncbi:type III secretion system export apparatus subunit SctT [uncultured Thiohalocapsa sp.]|uniref:type III secretion system export apparatus subunit SctT n=1 Tax=uncultured Thiohalocapsa sp. TaxID=768990 RepID=UPI00014B7ADD|nr:type III secretion system export apparatus subunit SctT [uncultured Thiohalocapsa sp.]